MDLGLCAAAVKSKSYWHFRQLFLKQKYEGSFVDHQLWD